MSNDRPRRNRTSDPLDKDEPYELARPNAASPEPDFIEEIPRQHRPGHPTSDYDRYES